MCEKDFYSRSIDVAQIPTSLCTLLTRGRLPQKLPVIQESVSDPGLVPRPHFSQHDLPSEETSASEFRHFQLNM